MAYEKNRCEYIDRQHGQHNRNCWHARWCWCGLRGCCFISLNWNCYSRGRDIDRFRRRHPQYRSNAFKRGKWNYMCVFILTLAVKTRKPYVTPTGSWSGTSGCGVWIDWTVLAISIPNICLVLAIGTCSAASPRRVLLASWLESFAKPSAQERHVWNGGDK